MQPGKAECPKLTAAAVQREEEEEEDEEEEEEEEEEEAPPPLRQLGSANSMSHINLI